jgi:hypothetical protein
MVNEKDEKIEDITQSPLEIELKDGKIYKFGTIGLIDFGDFLQYIKSQRINLVNNLKSKKLQIHEIKKIMNESINLDKEYGTLNGLCYMAWKAIQKYQPEITLSDMNKLIDLDNLDKVKVIMDNLGKLKNPKKAKANS